MDHTVLPAITPMPAYCGTCVWYIFTKITNTPGRHNVHKNRAWRLRFDTLCSRCRARSDVTATCCNSQSRRRSHIPADHETGSDVSVSRRQKTTHPRRCAAAAECDRLPEFLNERRFGVNHASYAACLSVRPSVCHTMLMRQNQWPQDHAVSQSGSSKNLPFMAPNFRLRGI